MNIYFKTGRKLTPEQKEEKVKAILISLKEAGICLNSYRFKVEQTGASKEVYQIGPDIGFKFICEDYQGLIKAIESTGRFRLDDRSTPSGCVMALVTDGLGFRQIGLGSSIHFQINKRHCDVHIDSRGIVSPITGYYDFYALARHLNSDLIPSFIPGLHFTERFNVTLYASLSTRFDPMGVVNGLTEHGDFRSKGWRALETIGSNLQIGLQVYDDGNFRFGAVIQADNPSKPKFVLEYDKSWFHLNAEISSQRNYLPDGGYVNIRGNFR